MRQRHRARNREIEADTETQREPEIETERQRERDGERGRDRNNVHGDICNSVVIVIVGVDHARVERNERAGLLVQLYDTTYTSHTPGRNRENMNKHVRFSPWYRTNRYTRGILTYQVYYTGTYNTYIPGTSNKYIPRIVKYTR